MTVQKRKMKYCEDCDRYFHTQATAGRHRRKGHTVVVTDKNAPENPGGWRML